MKYRIIIIFLLITSLFLANYNLNSKKPLFYKVNEIFPYKFYEWTGTDIKVDKFVYTMLDPDELLFRTYQYKDKKIHLTIVLTNKRDHIHDPQVCYRGQGVNMDNQKRIKFGQDINAYRVIAEKKQGSYEFVYWYTDLNKTYSSRIEFMKHIIVSNLLNKRIPSYVLVSITGLNVNEKELKTFSEQVNSKLNELGKNENSNSK